MKIKVEIQLEDSTIYVMEGTCERRDDQNETKRMEQDNQCTQRLRKLFCTCTETKHDN